MKKKVNLMARKSKKTFSRKARTGFAAAPTDSFRNFNDYIRVDVDKKDVIAKIKGYLKITLSKSDAALANQAPDWAFSGLPLLASTIAWKEMDNEFPSWWDAEKVLSKHVRELVQRGKRKLAEAENKDESVDIPRKSIQEIVQERTSEFIGGIDVVIDNWDTMIDDKSFSIYDELKKIDAPYNMAKTVYEYYTPQLKEMQELINNKSEDLVEAYSHMSVRDRKQFAKFLEQIVSDADKFMTAKKATRKARKPKVKTADKQVEKVKYLKDSNEFKIASINPSSVIGAMRVYVFNVKYKALTELVCQQRGGFTVKGTTLQGIDVEQSRSTKLRKPELFLPIVLSKTPKQIDKEWGNLTTKTNDGNGRLNSDTIILRAINK
tara:strand:+ start:13382 stop:14515 length:1134 start_codon:yes stop_codon:yes gene_type:complete